MPNQGRERFKQVNLAGNSTMQANSSKMVTQTTKPENMLPIMIVLGIMFLGICIAMNLFSRARFKKRSNVFATTGRATPQRYSKRGMVGGGGSGQRLGSYCSTPIPSATPASVTVNATTPTGKPNHQSNYVAPGKATNC